MKAARACLWLLATTAATTVAGEIPPLRREIDTAFTRGIDFLIATQRPRGAWGGPTKTKALNIYAPLPGAHHAFRAGSTTLALCGVLDSGDTRPETQAAIGRCADWIERELPKLRRADTTTTYNVWGHAYGLRALTRLHARETTDAGREKWTAIARQQIDLASRYEDLNGGWGYLDVFDEVATRQPSGITTSFTSATMLLGMAEARDKMELALDGKTVRSSIDSIRRQRTPDFSYAYSHGHRFSPRGDINRPAGSLARSQACNAALRTFGDKSVTDEVIITWADRFLAREGWLDIGRKRPVPHETHFKISGYFYYYGIYYFTESVRLLPREKQVQYAEKLAALILRRQEKDGSWWDYPLYDYHQPYGTGYALMALAWCRDVIDADLAAAR
ncbi:MAG: hypothetical protein ACO3JG_01615 [Luteolibacter sp.]